MERKDLASKAGMAYSTLADIENDSTGKCTNIAKLSLVLGVVPIWLEAGEGVMRIDQEPPAEPVATHTDPASAALAELDRLYPAKAALFRAEIALALQEALEKQAAAPPKFQQSA
jgi:transcriptional regulator with XRE-family HTH domain